MSTATTAATATAKGAFDPFFPLYADEFRIHRGRGEPHVRLRRHLPLQMLATRE